MSWAWIKFTCVIDTEVGLWPKKRSKILVKLVSRIVVLHLPAAFFIHHGFKRLEIITLPSSTNASDITRGKEKWKTFSLVRRNHLFEMVSSASPRRNYGALPRLVSSSSSECRVSIFGFPRKQLRVSPLEDCRSVKVSSSGEEWQLVGWAELCCGGSKKCHESVFFICCQREFELLPCSLMQVLHFGLKLLQDEEILFPLLTTIITIMTDPF